MNNLENNFIEYLSGVFNTSVDEILKLKKNNFKIYNNYFDEWFDLIHPF